MGVTAKALSIGLQPIEVNGPTEFESEFSGWTEKQIGGLVILDHPDFLASFDVIAALAAKHRLPSIGALELPASGGLMGYGVRFSEMFRRAAALVDKILKGGETRRHPGRTGYQIPVGPQSQGRQGARY